VFRTAARQALKQKDGKSKSTLKRLHDKTKKAFRKRCTIS
jgi:hypothetical protein